jgi:NAD(P)-dependent dehydrogenase (short-subunit alcohol dehydrogenase family)
MESDTLFDLQGKTAVVTGGGGALAGAIAQTLGERGVRVAILDLNEVKARERVRYIEKQGGQARAYVCSVLEEEELQNVDSEIRELWGGVDLLLNGAGGNDPRTSTEKEFLEPEDLGREDVFGFFDIKIEDFNQVFALNFTGTLIPTRIFSRSMAERKSGSIVNIASLNALTPLTKIPAYSAAKAAVANFTRWLAVHFSHIGVRVNALAPGFFMTEQLRFLHVDQKTGEYTPRAKKVIAHTPMARYGRPEELVGTVLWLFSNASSFVTGALIPIDGGYSSYTI